MVRLLDKLVILGVGILSGCTGPVYAKRDYDQYPDYRREIALYNVQAILRDICDISSADEKGFQCQKKICTSSHSEAYTSSQACPFTGSCPSSTTYRIVCDELETRDLSQTWDTLAPSAISVTKKNLNIGGVSIPAKDFRQASELKEAMEEYLKN